MPAFETSNAAAADAQSFGIRSDWRDDDGNNNTSSSSLLAKPIKTVKDKFELLPAFLKVRGLGTTTTLVSRAHSFGLVSLCSSEEAQQEPICDLSYVLFSGSLSREEDD